MNRQYKALSMGSALNTLTWTPRDEQGRRIRDDKGRPVRIVVLRDEHEPYLAGVRERVDAAEARRKARIDARAARRAERARR